MREDTSSLAHRQAKVRIEQLLDDAIGVVEKVRLQGPAVEARTVSEASTLAAQAVGFIEACALLAPELVAPEQGRVEALGAAVAGLGDSVTPRPQTSVASITTLPRVGGDRRQSSRPDDNPRRVTVRRVLADRRLAERRVVADRRAL